MPTLDVALAIDALQAGLDGKIDVAVLISIAGEPARDLRTRSSILVAVGPDPGA
jgi:hypothetical protein